MCHLTLFISADDRLGVNVWKCAPQVSETSISMSNGRRWTMENSLADADVKG